MKTISKNLVKNCSVCNKTIAVKLYKDKTYTGGHYFGSMVISKQKAEYWECDKCYMAS